LAFYDGGNLRRGAATVTKTDEDAIREIELQFNEAWGRHDANGMVASLSDDAQFITVNGAWTKTRADYLELMTRLHGPNGPFRTSTRETPIMHVRFLAPDAAMMHSEFHIYGDVDEPTRTGIGTRVVRTIDGRWRTVAVQNTDGAPRSSALSLLTQSGHSAGLSTHKKAPDMPGLLKSLDREEINNSPRSARRNDS
jgi:uncharacterized protein (TIGR02246 family)